MRPLLALLVGAITVLLAGCQKSSNYWGPDFNAQRQKIGLPVIPSNWYVIKDTIWVNPEREIKTSQHIPVYFSKSITQKGGKLISETDLYYGSMEYMLEGQSFREFIQITYYYPLEGLNSKWEIILYDQSTIKSTKSEISLSKAEEILKSWGLSRLDVGQTQH